jgi:hypothetical protein
MTDEDDYQRAENCLEDYENRIKAQYKKPFDDLTTSEKNDVILDIFFSRNGKPQENYRNSANALRHGLEARKKGKTENITHYKRKNGVTYYVVRIPKGEKGAGQFKRFLKV